MPQHRKQHIRRFILVPVITLAIGSAIMVYTAFVDVSPEKSDMEFGATFSTKYSKELGLDWQEVYLASLNELNIKLYRIPVYWDEIQPEESMDSLRLEHVQWMMDEAQAHNARVILAIGQRVPRWPECHPPAWTKNMSQEDIHAHELAMMEAVVERFRDHPALYQWQVHNEAYFDVFGECAQPDERFISRSINRVRELDPHTTIMTTDSGELSTWANTSAVADVLGISMYRVTWNSFFGYFYYPIPPSFYTKKAEIIAPWVDEVIISELQAEPWTPTTMLYTDLDEQFHSMDVERFENNVAFARKTGFRTTLLWGLEWWYWLREVHGIDDMWNAAHTVYTGT